jgi:hypothetical protein
MRFTPTTFALLLACTLGGCATPPDRAGVEPLEASFACEVDAISQWSFAFAASGPTDEVGTEVLVFSDAVANDFAYSMVFDGANGDARSDFSLSIDGTEPGETPFPGDVPFACEDLGTVQVMFCALDRLSREELCWACEWGGSLPSGAAAFIACG